MGPASSRRTNQPPSDERAAALANVRRMMSGEGARTPSPPNVSIQLVVRIDWSKINESSLSDKLFKL